MNKKKFEVELRNRKLKKTVAAAVHAIYWDDAEAIAKAHCIRLFPNTTEWDWDIEEMHQPKQNRKRRMI